MKGHQVQQWALGGLICVLLGVLLPLALDSSGDAEDLYVVVPGARRPLLARESPAAPLTKTQPGPLELLPRLQPAGQLDRVGTGPGLLRWRVVYGKRWEREVQLPVWTGPFHDAELPGPCAFGLILRPALFDDGKRGGGDLASMVDALVRRSFPINIKNVVSVYFPPVNTTDVKLELRAGEIGSRVSVVLQDGTRFRVNARFGLSGQPGNPGRPGGRLQLVLKEARLLEWSGPTRDELGGFMGSLARVLLGDDNFDELVQRAAEPIVRGRIAAALKPFELPPAQAWFPGRNQDEIGITLCGAPRVEATGVYLPLSVQAALEPRRDEALPGPIRLPAEISWPSQPLGGARIELVAGRAGVNQLMYVAWQAGLIADFEQGSAPVEALRQEIGGRLHFELQHINFALPPLYGGDTDSAGRWPIRLHDVRLGKTHDGRQVSAHLDLRVTPRIDERGIRVLGRLENLALSCHTARAGEVRLSPCLADVLPVVRPELVGREQTWPLDAGLLQRLSTSSISGYRVNLSRFSGGPEPKSGGLRIGAHAELAL